MTETTYYCNVCTDKKEPKELLCIYWDNGKYTLVKDVTLSPKHICLDCLAMIRLNDNLK